jgi:hypothetical protein
MRVLYRSNEGILVEYDSTLCLTQCGGFFDCDNTSVYYTHSPPSASLLPFLYEILNSTYTGSCNGNANLWVNSRPNVVSFFLYIFIYLFNFEVLFIFL